MRRRCPAPKHIRRLVEIGLAVKSAARPTAKAAARAAELAAKAIDSMLTRPPLLLSFQDLGTGSVAYLREKLGLKAKGK